MTGASWQEALQELGALEAPIDAALASGNVASAARLAFSGASEAAALVGGEGASDGLITVHGVYVELAPLPLDTLHDGTMVENGAYVSLTYQSWNVNPEQAERLVDRWSGTADKAVDSS